MQATIYCAILTVIQIVIFILYLVKRSKNVYDVFMPLTLSSVVIDALVLCYALTSGFYYGWDGVGIFAISIIFMIVHIVLCIIGKVVSFFITNRSLKKVDLEITTKESDREEDSEEEEEKILKVKKITLVPKVSDIGKKTYKIVIITTAVIFLLDIGYNLDVMKDIEENKEKYSKQVEKELTEKYGDYDFKVEKVEYYEKSGSGILESYDTHYEFTVKTNQMKETFRVVIYEDEPEEISTESFIETYCKSTFGTDDVEEYIEEYAIEQFKSGIKERFNINIIATAYLDYDYDDMINKLPTKDDLLEYVVIEDIKIEILDNMLTREQLNEYLISLTEYMVKNLNEETLRDMQKDMMFKFMCDYKNLGIKNDLDKYNDYCGFAAIVDSKVIRIQAFDKTFEIPF